MDIVSIVTQKSRIYDDLEKIVNYCNNDIEMNSTTYYCKKEFGHNSDHRYEILDGDYWCGKFEYLRDELEAISVVERDSPAALGSVLLIANEALSVIRGEHGGWGR